MATQKMLLEIAFKYINQFIPPHAIEYAVGELTAVRDDNPDGSVTLDEVRDGLTVLRALQIIAAHPYRT